MKTDLEYLRDEATSRFVKAQPDTEALIFLGIKQACDAAIKAKEIDEEKEIKFHESLLDEVRTP